MAPASKTKTAQKPAVEEIDIDTIDFDAWTEDEEEAAVAELSSDAKIQHVIRGSKYYAKFPDGTRVSLPAKLKFKVIQEISRAGDGAVDQMLALVNYLEYEGLEEVLAGQDTNVVVAFADDYFTLLAKISNATAGE